MGDFGWFWAILGEFWVISGDLEAISQLRNLVGLGLRDLQLTGSVSLIENFEKAQLIELDSNRLTGQLPVGTVLKSVLLLHQNSIAGDVEVFLFWSF